MFLLPDHDFIQATQVRWDLPRDHPQEMQGLPSPLRNLVASFLPLRDVVALSKTSKSMEDKLALAQISMQIPFKSWCDDAVDGPQLRKGPRLPFLQYRTHSVTLTGSWSCGFGELKGKSSQNFQAQFYIVASPRKDQESPQSLAVKSFEPTDFRIVWESKPLFQRHCSKSSATWVKLSASFVPKNNEDYFLCIQPGPGKAAQQHWWRYSLQMSNLVAIVYYHDEPQSDFLMKRQYQTIVKHMLHVENRGAYYTKLLEAIARSIRIQIATFGRNALDPVLEGFFDLTGIPRETASLLALEEIARFLSQYSYISESKRRRFNIFYEDTESVHEGSSSHRDPSVPDWMPYSESSTGCRRGMNANLSKEKGDFTRRGGESDRRLSLRHLQDLFVRIRGTRRVSSVKWTRRRALDRWIAQDATEEMSAHETSFS